MSAIPTQKEKLMLLLESMGIPFEEKAMKTNNYLSRKVTSVIVIRAEDRARAKVVGDPNVVSEFGFDKDGNFYKGYLGT